jgi:branched-chain amino acid transport system ATP-binding protein
MTALENVLSAVTFGNSKKIDSPYDFAMELLDLVGLRQKANTLTKSFNVGERKFLDLARALGTSPKVLLVDEFVAGLGKEEIASAVRLLSTLSEGGMSLFVVEHKIDFIVELCDRMIVLNFGQKIADGGSDVLRMKLVVDSYLGETA